MTHPNTPRRRVRRAGAAAVAALALTVTWTPTALADDGDAQDPPGSFQDDSDSVAAIDGSDPDLELPDGATLAEPKVLDIKFIVETDGGEERKETSNDQIKVALQAEVLFDKDSSRLNSRADTRIADIARQIESQGADEVNVFGFTDNLGSYQHGVVLSKARAQAVQKELAARLGSGVRYNIRGYSEDYPIADNSTEEGRKKNRRVEVSFPRTA
ncbi:OmpA family protein [Streptomyces sp. TR06-5]|uniref:OmpA family protein n=1 Tax=Streptomyces sp. TR06-5 TaxID=3385976 RepID=UPI0039A3685B